MERIKQLEVANHSNLSLRVAHYEVVHDTTHIFQMNLFSTFF